MAQHTPCAQIPLAHVVPVEQDDPSWLRDVVHAPLLQVCPEVHTWLHPPQLLGSVIVLTHVDPHAVSLPGQLGWHTPPASQVPPLPMQDSPGVIVEHVPLVTPVRAIVQAWQLLPVQAVLQHTPCGEQFPLAHVVPIEQAAPFALSVAVVQAPALQLCPEVHLVPQAPQLFGSVMVFVHVPLHDVCPDPQVAPPEQAPLVQGWPVAHALPQLPQFDGSDDVVSQMPEHKVPGHESVSPVACILYSTSKLASAPVFEVQDEPVRSDACKVAPAANVRTMGPLSDQY